MSLMEKLKKMFKRKGKFNFVFDYSHINKDNFKEELIHFHSYETGKDYDLCIHSEFYEKDYSFLISIFGFDDDGKVYSFRNLTTCVPNSNLDENEFCVKIDSWREADRFITETGLGTNTGRIVNWDNERYLVYKVNDFDFLIKHDYTNIINKEEINQFEKYVEERNR